MESTTRERLKKKINDKKKNRNGKQPVEPTDIFSMLNQVNKMLKENPEMVKKVSKSVNSIFENKSLMDSIVNEIKNTSAPDQTSVVQDQTLVSKVDSESDSE
jgi:hypothetical protein